LERGWGFADLDKGLLSFEPSFTCFKLMEASGRQVLFAAESTLC